MAEHRISKNGIIYVIPNDELYQKYKNGEAFIDKYGRFVNAKTHRVIKELTHYADKHDVIQKVTVPPSPVQNKKKSPTVEHFKRRAANQAINIGDDVIEKGLNWFTYDIVLPNIKKFWDRKVIPFAYDLKDAFSSKKLKVDDIQEKHSKMSNVVTEVLTSTPTQETGGMTINMTKEEADSEKRKVLYHWLGLLDGLTKLHNAGEIDINEVLEQLTNPEAIKRVNEILYDNPNILEMDKYIQFRSLLGRDLFQENKLVPIQMNEIAEIVKLHNFELETDKEKNQL